MALGQGLPSEVVVSIDKVSVTASPLGQSDEVSLLDWLGLDFVVDKHLESYRPYPVGKYGKTWRVGGVIVQAEPVWVGRPRPVYRLCWNPQTADPEVVHALLARVQVERVTRVDVAIDYLREWIGNLTPWVPRTTWDWWLNGDAVGSYRYGASRAARVVRIYDKPAERAYRGTNRWSVVDCCGERRTFAAGDQDVTRVEVSARGNRAELTEDLFDRVSLIRRNGCVKVPNGDIVDELAVRGFAAAPWLLSEIASTNRQTRYRRLLLDPSVTEQVNPTPADAWALFRPAVIDQLSSWLRVDSTQFHAVGDAAKPRHPIAPTCVPQPSPCAVEPIQSVPQESDELPPGSVGADYDPIYADEMDCVGVVRDLGYAEETWGETWRLDERMNDERWKEEMW